MGICENTPTATAVAAIPLLSLLRHAATATSLCYGAWYLLLRNNNNNDNNNNNAKSSSLSSSWWFLRLSSWNGDHHNLDNDNTVHHHRSSSPMQLPPPHLPPPHHHDHPPNDRCPNDDDNNNNNIEHNHKQSHHHDHYRDKWQRHVENYDMIQRVIRYWFVESGPPDVALKKLWMIPQQDHDKNAYRATIDYDITQRFGSYILALVDHHTGEPTDRWKEWCDIIIDDDDNNNNHSSSVDDHQDNDRQHGSSLVYGYQGKVAAIIVLDQLSRHVHRYKKESTSASSCQQPDTHDDDAWNLTTIVNFVPEQSILDQVALRTSELFNMEHQSEIMVTMMIPLPQYIFALMPYRHTKQLSLLQMVQHHIDHIMSILYVPQHDTMVKHFRKATNRRVALLQDEDRSKYHHHHHTGMKNAPSAHDDDDDVNRHNNTNTNKNNDDDDQDNGTIRLFTDDDILECGPFDADMELAKDHIVTQTIRQFLKEQLGIEPSSSCDENDHNKHNSKTTTTRRTKKNQKNRNNQHRHNSHHHHNNDVTATSQVGSDHISPNHHDDNTSEPISSPTLSGEVTNEMIAAVPQTKKLIPIIVSLSGGVDSMVLIRILSYLRTYGGYHDYRIQLIAIHIDYANRIESYSEALYVQRYCQQYSIDYYCRRIEEVTRGITDRHLYETIARDIRYQFYKEIIAKYQQSQQNHDGASSLSSSVGIWLGHHRGDIRENVLSNAHKGCGPLDLSGMTSISKNDGVVLYRPLLRLEKESIYDYAHTYGVPYFKDTTPSWSTRGKLRHKLLPLLEEIYGDGCMNNLNHLAKESDDCRLLLYETLMTPFMNKIHYEPMGIYFPTHPYKHLCLYFWKFIMKEILHSIHLGMFSDKSIEYCFVPRIQADRIKEGWLQCRKDYAVYLRQDGMVFIYYPTYFPWQMISNKHPQQPHKSNSLWNHHDDMMYVPYGDDNHVQIGPWRVSVRIVRDDNHHPTTDIATGTGGGATAATTSDSIEALLHHKAVPSMEHFMKGHIVYYLQVPTWPSSDAKIVTADSASNSTGEASYHHDHYQPRPLILTKFLKETRPPAWKNVDTKLQEVLPILGNDEISQKALKDVLRDRNNDDDAGVASSKANPIVLVQVTIQLSKDK